MARLCKIKASAGSGKTHTLTRRYLDLVLSCQAAARHGGVCSSEWDKMPHSPGDILAITFTNAAVAEMRERVLQDLKKAALGKIVIEDRAPEDARACLENLLLNMGAMNIRTIDSLLHQITRSSALNLGLAPDFEPTFNVMDAFEPYTEQFLRSAESGDAEANRLLDEVVFRAMRYEEQSAGDKPRSLLPSKELAKRMEPFLSEALLEMGGMLASASEVERRLEDLKSRVTRLVADFENTIEDIFPMEAGGSSILLARFQDKFASFKNGDFSKTSIFQGYQDNVDGLFPAAFRKKNSEALAQLEAPYRNLRKAIGELGYILKPYQDYLKNAPIIDLARRLATEFNKGLQNGGAPLPSTLMAHYAKKALDCEYGICDALCRMGNRLTHFLVDEFQDTSRDQWEGFRLFVEDALGRGGTMTWVGDVKQSIYTWRNAAPELFDEIQNQETLKKIEPKAELINLPMNRRSAKVIVDFNNALFTPLENLDHARDILTSLLKDAALELALPRVAAAYAGSYQHLPEGGDRGGFVRIERIGENDQEFNASYRDHLVEALKNDIHPGRSWSDIMILVRKGETASELANELVAQNIPVVTENSLLLAVHPLIVQIVAFLSFLDNPRNEPAFLALVTGSIFREFEGMPDLPGPDLLPLLKNEKNLHDFFREKYPDIWQRHLEPFYSQAPLFTAYDATREWYRRMDVEARYAEESLFLRSFLEVLQNADAAGVSSISGFLKYWNEKGAEARAHTPENIDAVRIMTIHKAKGLQAPVVIVPLPASSMRLKTNKYKTNIIKEIGGLLLQVPFLKNYEPEYSQTLATEALECLNLLYVAFTRPRNELYIYTPETSDTLLDALLKKAERNNACEWGQKTAAQNAKPDITQPARVNTAGADTSTLPLAWLPSLKIAHSQLSSQKFSAADRGTFLHFCLENTTFAGDAENDAEMALQFGLSHSGIDVPQDDEIRDALRKSLAWCAACPQMREWLDKGWPEQPVMDREGNELRVDLLVPQPWGALVVDYKSGKPSKEHVEQIQNYLKCVEAEGMFPGRALGLLIYLDERLFRVISRDKAGQPVSQCPDFQEVDL